MEAMEMRAWWPIRHYLPKIFLEDITLSEDSPTNTQRFGRQGKGLDGDKAMVVEHQVVASKSQLGDNHTCGSLSIFFYNPSII